MQRRVNLVFQGGGAKGALYAGTLRAIQKQNLKVQTSIGTSAGSLASTIVALNVPADDMQAYFDPNALYKPEGLGSPISIQDRIPRKIRNCLMRQNEKKYSGLLSRSNWLINLIMEKYLGCKLVDGIEEAFDAPYIAQELMFNGSYIAGYGLVATVENFLNKYLPETVDCEERRKNITMKEFKKATQVNLVIMGSDISAGVPRIFSATTTPDLPVKYAVRISSGIPFYFPPIYWDPKWGKYLGQSINEHMFVDGGVLWNLPIGVIAAREEFQLRYLGETIDPDTIAAFHFLSLIGPFEQFEYSMHGVQDADIEAIPPDYRLNIKKTTKLQSWEDFGFHDIAPGIYTAEKLVPAVILGMGENFQIQLYSERIGYLESKNLNVLNFGLYGVPLGQDIDAAEKVSANLFEKLKL